MCQILLIPLSVFPYFCQYRLASSRHDSYEHIRIGNNSYEKNENLSISPLGRARCRWEEKIRMDLKEIINVRNWVDSAQDRDYWRALVNTALTLQVSYAI
jgi:hypothetical protein